MSEFSDNLGAINDSAGLLFGGRQNQNTNTQQQQSGTQRSRLEIDEEGIFKMIEDVIGGRGGLGDIFAFDSAMGLKGSSTSSDATADLLTSIAGQLAQLTGETVTENEAESESETTSISKDKGLLERGKNEVQRIGDDIESGGKKIEKEFKRFFGF